MDKNNQYVGVDEQFIPEEEKNKTYVDPSLIKHSTKKKLFKGVGVAYIVIGVITVAVIITCVVVFINIANTSQDTMQDIRETHNQLQQEAMDQYNSTKQNIEDQESSQADDNFDEEYNKALEQVRTTQENTL